MAGTKPSILLVDDDQESLDNLGDRLRELLDDDANLVIWRPTTADGPTHEAFDDRINQQTALVITDYDLTTSVNGLFGLSIVGWCQGKFIPAGDFSRANLDALPREPSLFELRVPTNFEQAAQFINNMFRGFHDIRLCLEGHPEVLTQPRSLAAVLAILLDKPQSESMLAAYMTKLGAANSALLQTIKQFAEPNQLPTDEDKARLLTYVLGHVLANAVLRYPGPIVSIEALCAYFGTNLGEADALSDLFGWARYNGPFGHADPYFWHEDVDAILDDIAADLDDQEFDSFAEYNRYAVERYLNRPLVRHACTRCDGTKGGFWCPFTMRAVCERGDCSVPASSWIPSGAQLRRVEKDFHDEWAPILGY